MVTNTPPQTTSRDTVVIFACACRAGDDGGGSVVFGRKNEILLRAGRFFAAAVDPAQFSRHSPERQNKTRRGRNRIVARLAYITGGAGKETGLPRGVAM